LLLITCDMMVEGIHFRREWATPWQIGWKAMAQNLSDIAAMGGEPAFAVSSVAAPGDAEQAVAEGIAEGLVACAARYGAALVGGDLVGSPGPLVVDVAATGWVEEELVLRRGGARVGDAVLVTGALGASAAGLLALSRGLADRSNPQVARALQAHHEPQPRLAEARAIARTRLATAMMDLSDGLADDLPRLCAASGVAARLCAEKIPVDPACSAIAEQVGADALALATSGGEDYELLLTCSPEAVGQVTEAVSAVGGARATIIGEIVSGEGVSLVNTKGEALPLRPGFDHFATPAARSGQAQSGDGKEM
jgi:thiamine-monophosphate kinase